VAEETIAGVDASGHWPGRAVTQISEAGHFWEDPPEDQDHLLRFPEYPQGSTPPSPTDERQHQARGCRFSPA
jgi:peptide-methionine (S)-S-oxide reductase